MDLSALVDAKARYNASAGCYDETLAAVIDQVATNGSLGKADIGALVFWKRLRADTTWASALQLVPDAEVRAITAGAVAAVRDRSLSLEEAGRRGRAALLELPGCGHGHALPSALLLAAAPDRMAVYDRHAETGLKALGLSSGGRYSRYMAAVDDLVQRLSDQGLTWLPRDVDVALFTLGRATASQRRQ